MGAVHAQDGTEGFFSTFSLPAEVLAVSAPVAEVVGGVGHEMQVFSF